MPGICRMTIDVHFNPLDVCGCDDCPHAVYGHATTGSSVVFVDEYPALRANGVDVGVHTGCCGSNTWATKDGSPVVFVDGHPVVRNGDANVCCGGGDPRMITGSEVVFAD
jgi:uncharacterized Zn-binding protein involved in type VI secretion